YHCPHNVEPENSEKERSTPSLPTGTNTGLRRPPYYLLSAPLRTPAAPSRPLLAILVCLQTATKFKIARAPTLTQSFALSKRALLLLKTDLINGRSKKRSTASRIIGAWQGLSAIPCLWAILVVNDEI